MFYDLLDKMDQLILKIVVYTSLFSVIGSTIVGAAIYFLGPVIRWLKKRSNEKN